jgi:hypothetical protein
MSHWFDDTTTMKQSSLRLARLCLSLWAALSISDSVIAKNPSMKPTVPTYTGPTFSGDASRHDGRLRPVVGVHETQVVRSLPNEPARTDGHPFDFRHHQFLMFWQGRFWTFHLGARGNEESSKRGLLQWSGDGLTWNKHDSMVIFDQATHQRAAFFVASNGRALVTTWYGGVEDARGQKGARLVRELRINSISKAVEPGPVYVLKANHRGLPSGLKAADFDTSVDEGFRAACREVLEDKLYVQQWQEEDQDPNFYAINSIGTSPMVRGFAWYVLQDGRIVGMWKGPHLLVATEQEWRHGRLPPPVKETTRLDGNRIAEYDQFGANGGSKQWGQRTSDGRYAMVFNSPGELHKRWPLVAATSADGLQFDSPMMVVCGDFAPQRYADATFDHKDGGAAYVRGIEPNNTQSDDDAMWLTYSTNKEDIWVARVPVPLTDRVTGDVSDDFSKHVPGPFVKGWNIRSTQLAPVVIRRDAGVAYLRLSDADASDYAKATRVFEMAEVAEVELDLTAEQSDRGELHIDIVDAGGARPVRLYLDDQGQIVGTSADDERVTLGRYAPGAAVRLRARVDATTQKATLAINDATPVVLHFAEPATSVERIELRTGAYRLSDTTRLGFYGGGFLKTVLDGADAPVSEAVYRVGRFDARRVRAAPNQK